MLKGAREVKNNESRQLKETMKADNESEEDINYLRASVSTAVNIVKMVALPAPPTSTAPSVAKAIIPQSNKHCYTITFFKYLRYLIYLYQV